MTCSSSVSGNEVRATYDFDGADNTELSFKVSPSTPSLLTSRVISLAENQRGINAVQQCSVENQNGTIIIHFVQR